MNKPFAYKLLAAVVMLSAIACHKENFKPEPEDGGLTAVALMAPMTKVQYEEGADGRLCGKWEKGDVILALGGDGAPFSFSVTDVDATGGTAILKAQTSRAFAAGDKVYAVYCPDGTSSGFADGVLTVDFSDQKAGGIPALMFAEAVVADGPSLSFNFRNAVSVIGIKSPSIEALNSNRKISRVLLSGHNVVSSGKVVLDGGKLSFASDVPSRFIEKEVQVAPVSGADGKFTLEKPVYVVVPPCTVDKVTFLDDKGTIYSYEVGGKEVVESKHYGLNSKEFSRVKLPVNTDVCAGGVFWSDRNLGAESVSSGSGAWGEMYRWADTELLYTEKVYNSKTITLKPEYPQGFAAVAGQNYYDGSAYTSTMRQMAKLSLIRSMTSSS